MSVQQLSHDMTTAQPEQTVVPLQVTQHPSGIRIVDAVLGTLYFAGWKEAPVLELFSGALSMLTSSMLNDGLVIVALGNLEVMKICAISSKESPPFPREIFENTTSTTPLSALRTKGVKA
jgi:hypothetical protein